MNRKEVKVIGLIVIIMLLVIGVLLVRNNKNGNEGNGEKELSIANLAELFPQKEGEEIKYQENGEKKKRKVTKIETNSEGNKEVTLQEKKKGTEGKELLIEMTYEVQAEKVIEKGRHIEEGQEVSVIYPLEIIVGMPYEGKQWDSVDGQTTNRVISTKEGIVEIESTRKIAALEGEKIVKEIRRYEKGKGLISYTSQVNE